MAMLDFAYHGHLIHLVTDTYVAGTLAVRAVGTDGEPWATLSVNLAESKNLPAGHFFGKNWSECTDIFAAALAAGVIEPADPSIHEPVRTGYVLANVYHLKEAATA